MDQTRDASIAAVSDERVRTLIVPTFRPVARRVLRLLEDRGDRSSELADLVLADAGLTLHVLAEANKAVAPTGHGIASVRVALEVLGREVIRDVVARMLSGAVLTPDGDGLRLYRHALVTSLVCESLARVVGFVDSAAARTAGLLHDVGSWVPGCGHDAEGAHARLGSRFIRRLGLPDDICGAVANHHTHQGDGSPDRIGELVSVLSMADRVATALCVTDPDGSHSMDFESGVAPRLRVLAQVAMDRAAREVADNMSVLGTLLGVPGLTLDSLIADFQRLDACEAPAPPPPPGLSATVRRGLEAVRGAVSEQEAIGLLIGVVRDTPGVRSVLLVMQDAGAAMVDGPTEKRPFFLKARDLAKVAEGFAGFLQHVRDRGAGVFARDPAHDGTFSLLKADAVLAIPVSAGRASVGVIVAPQPSARVTPEVAESLGLVAQAAGDALEALQLSRGSYLLSERIALDDLTGVLNRAPFFERLTAEVRAANRYRRPLSLAMIDVDAFKSWNDRYGHPVGDRLLRDVSKTIRDCAREGDVIGRYGGDEFIVALPGCTGEQAEAFAERVRQRVEALGTIMREACYEFLLSVSIGLASATTWPCESDVLLFRADHALYRAKRKGRNRVCSDTGGGPDA